MPGRLYGKSVIIVESMICLCFMHFGVSGTLSCRPYNMGNGNKKILE